MALPDSVQTVPVHVRVVAPDSGRPGKGQLMFSLPYPLRDQTGAVVVGNAQAITVRLDAAGEATVALPATDDPDLSPSGWAYSVEVITDLWRDRFRLEVPSSTVGTLELARVMPAVTPSPVVTYETPAGAQARADAAQAAAATDATNKVAAHVAGTDPHGDRAYATATFLTPADPRSRHDRVLRASPVASNCWAAGTPTNQTVAGTARTRHRIGPACSDLRLVYGGWYCADPATSGVDTDQPTSIPVKASVEIGGVIYRVTFGGLIQGTVDPGGMLVSDPLGFEIAAGTDIYVRTYTSSINWFSNSAVYSGYTSGGWNAADLTAPGSAAIADSAHFIYAPYAVLGMPVNRSAPTVAILGDSIAAGNADNNAYVAWGNGGTVGGGPISRALTAAGIGYVNLAHAGERASTFVLGRNRYRRSSMISGCTHAIVEYGVNDYRNARTTAQMQADLLAIWTAANQRGCKVFQTTITPNTSSTDAYATTVNQTIVNAGFEAARVALNDWLRDGAPILNGVAVATGSNAQGTLRAGVAGHPLTGFFEIADLAETARNSGIWRANYTTDGVHPVTTAAAAMTAGITTASLTLP